jgi:hypothetical protein
MREVKIKEDDLAKLLAWADKLTELANPNSVGQQNLVDRYRRFRDSVKVWGTPIEEFKGGNRND